MESGENAAIAAFDTLYTNNHIQILKVLLPYFDFKGKKQLAVLIKFMELRYTIEYFSKPSAIESALPDPVSKTGRQTDIVTLFEQIRNFCTPSERAMFDQLAGMKKSMELYEEMMGMMQLFSQLLPEDEDKSGENASKSAQQEAANPMDMLKGMLSPEQQTMFDLFQESFGNHQE